MQETSFDGKIYHKPFMRLVIVSGLVVCLLSVFRFPVEQINEKLLILAAVTVFLSSRIGIEFSRYKIQITVSDTFVFLALLLYGAEAAVLISAAEAFRSSLRFSKLWATRFFNASLLAVSTFTASAVINFVFGSPVELAQGVVTPAFVIAVCVLAVVQCVINTSIAAVREALKSGQPLWRIWKEYYLWTSISYFAGASAAAVTAKLINNNGFYALIAAVPLICVIYFSYQAYRKQFDAKAAQAEQAARHAEELRQSEAHFRGAFDYAAVGMALVATDGRWLRVNHSFCKLVGYAEEELLKMDFQSITHPDDLGSNLVDLYQMVEKKLLTISTEKRYIHKQGHEVWTFISASKVADSDGNLMHFIMQAQDITERKRAEARLHHAAFYDSLTDLPNRALFTEHLQLAIERAKRHPDHRYAVLFLDVDRFKNVNDSLGHVIGDQLLVNVARRLEKCIRAEDQVSRFGGDEFAVLLNGFNNPIVAVNTAERIQQELSLPFNLDGHEVFCGGSIGVALSTLEYTESEEIL